MKLIIYSLKKNSFFFLFLVFSSFCFGDIPWSDPVITSAPRPVKCVFYTFVSPSINSVTTSTINGIGSLDELALYYKNMPFGVAVSKGTPSVIYPVQNSTTNSNNSFNYSVCCYVSQGTANSYIQKWFSPRSFSLISSVYDFAALLYYSGYSGPGIVPVGEDGSRFYFNFDYRSAVADVLCSTNTVYRSLVLSHLSSVQSSVNNIDYGVSTISAALVPSLSRIEEINSGISSTLNPINENVSSINSYSAEMNETLYGTHNTLTNIDGVVSSIPSYLLANSNSLDRLHEDNALSNIDVFLGDDTSSWVGFVNWACDNFLITSSDRDLFIQELNDTDLSNSDRSRSYSIPLAHRRFLVKNKIKGRVVAANKMRGQLQMLYPSSDLNSSGSSWGVQAIGDIGHQFTTGVRHELMNNNATIVDWREGLRQQLQDWKTSDEHGILNVKNKIDDVDSAIKKNFEFKPNSHLTNTIPYTAFVTNFVVSPLTNSVDEAAGRIVTNDSAQAQLTRDFLQDNLFSSEAPGAVVRIKYPMYGVDEMAVHVHDDALDVFGTGIDELNYNVTAVLGDMNSRWSEWFRRWDDFAPPVHSNIEAILEVLLNWTNTTAQLNHVLFYDYSNYVHSASYEDLFSTLENDYPVCYSNLVKFGLSSSADGGRWWNVLSSSVSYDTAMMSYVFSDMVELDRIARDNLGESPFSFLQRTLSDMPSKSQIEDYVSQASNATSEVEYAFTSLSNSLASVSNSFDSVFNPFRGHFDSPGSSVTFFKIHDGHDGQYVTIPVSDQADAWRYIRLGVSFGLVAVNLLLFPKYLLMLFTLFIKAYRIGIKFFPDDR